MIITHTDLDGFVSAMIVSNATKDNQILTCSYDSDRTKTLTKLISAYDKPNPIYILDLAFSEEELKILKEQIGDKKVIMIDHHAGNSAQKYFPDSIISEEASCVKIISKLFPEGMHDTIKQWSEYAHKRDAFEFKDNNEYLECLSLTFVVKNVTTTGKTKEAIKNFSMITPQMTIAIYKEQISVYYSKLEKSFELAKRTAKKYNVDGYALVLCFISDFATDVSYLLRTEYQDDIIIFGMIQVFKEVIISLRLYGECDLSLADFASKHLNGGGHKKSSAGKLHSPDILEQGYLGIVNLFTQYIKSLHSS